MIVNYYCRDFTIQYKAPLGDCLVNWCYINRTELKLKVTVMIGFPPYDTSPALYLKCIKFRKRKKATKGTSVCFIL